MESGLTVTLSSCYFFIEWACLWIVPYRVILRRFLCKLVVSVYSFLLLSSIFLDFSLPIVCKIFFQRGQAGKSTAEILQLFNVNPPHSNVQNRGLPILTRRDDILVSCIIFSFYSSLSESTNQMNCSTILAVIILHSISREVFCTFSGQNGSRVQCVKTLFCYFFKNSFELRKVKSSPRRIWNQTL